MKFKLFILGMIISVLLVTIMETYSNYDAFSFIIGCLYWLSLSILDKLNEGDKQ